MVEVFKTNVEGNDLADRIIEILNLEWPDCRINFDLEDCDRILRVEGEILQAESIRKIVSNNGIHCEILL